MRFYLFILVILKLLYVFHAQGQEPEDTSNIFNEVQWEKLMETVIQDKEDFQIDEEIAQWEDNPLNLNTASIEELHRIPAMTNLLASRIVARRKHQPFSSVDELLTIEGMTQELFSFIRQYVRVRRQKERSDLAGSFLSKESAEMEKRKGFLNGAYAGSPLKTVNRLRVGYSTIEVGVLAEKDPGEQSLTNFSSGYANILVPELSTRFIVGDYLVEAAEGLIFWRALSFSKGSDVISPIRKNGSGIRPYLSSNENSFFRGLAASLDLDDVQIQLMYSNKLLNATVDSTGRISSLYQDGLFRTENELRKKNSTREKMIGCRAVAHIFDGFRIGGTSYRTHYANPMVLKREIDVARTDLWMQGMDVAYSNQKIDMFTECALDWANSLAIISGMTYEPLPLLSLSFVARKYPSTFQSIHGNAFGESSDNVQNENGVYVGVRFQPIDWLWISTYYDQFEHPQSTQFIPAPSRGDDFLALAECQITKQYELILRFKRKNSPSVIDNIDLYGRAIKQVIPRIQENYRLTSEFISSSSVRLRSRVEWATVNYGGMKRREEGLLLSQSIKWTAIRPLTMQTRITIFETDSYDSRIYEFEDDLAGAFSCPALYGRGMRWYFILRCQLVSKIHLSAKYAQTIKEGVKTLGTGLDEIEGNSQSTLSMQIDIRF